MKMDGIRQQLFIDYMYYLNETDRFYATKARYAKHVLDFLESASSVDRRGFMAFKREHSLKLVTRHNHACHPKKDDVVTRYQIVGGVIVINLFFVGIKAIKHRYGP